MFYLTEIRRLQDLFTRASIVSDASNHNGMYRVYFQTKKQKIFQSSSEKCSSISLLDDLVRFGLANESFPKSAHVFIDNVQFNDHLRRCEQQN